MDGRFHEPDAHLCDPPRQYSPGTPRHHLDLHSLPFDGWLATDEPLATLLGATCKSMLCQVVPVKALDDPAARRFIHHMPKLSRTTYDEFRGRTSLPNREC